MDITPTLMTQLEKQHVRYETIHHDSSISSLNTAHRAQIPAQQLVKPVVLHDAQGYVMALVPSTRYVYISKLNDMMHRNLELATEGELVGLFYDCESGAIPPIGQAYGMQTVIDCELECCNEIYIEAGNHKDVVHMSGNAFHKLMTDCVYEDIAIH